MKRQRHQTVVNHDFFKVWTPEMAYVFGFWFADGNISRPNGCFAYSVRFRSSDCDHLVLIRDVMGSAHRIYDKRDGTYELAIGSRTLWSDIQVLGGVPAKSLVCQFPDVPREVLVHFVQGYIDGDGSLYWNRSRNYIAPAIHICGTATFLTSMSIAIRDVTGIPIPKVYRYGTKVPGIRYTGIKAKALAIWLYLDAGLYLQRKRDIAMDFKDWFPKRSGFKKGVVTDQMRQMFGKHLQRD